MLKHDSSDADKQCESHNISSSSSLSSINSVGIVTVKKKFNIQSNSDISDKLLESTHEEEQETVQDETCGVVQEQLINLKKRPIDSMSSSLSDQSLSSVCGDTSEIESAIQDLTDYPEKSIEKIPKHSMKKSKSIEACASTTKASSTSSLLSSKYSNQNPTTSSSISSLLEDKENDVNFCKVDLPGALLGMTYRFLNTETKLLRKILSSHGLTEVVDEDMFNLLWTGVHIKPDILRNLVSYQRVNHFPR